jgi:hypothetical protein
MLAMPCFATVASIESVIGLLPIEWRRQLKQATSKQSLKEYVFELLEICAAQPGGFTALLKAVRFYDGGTLQLQALVEELGKLKLQESLPGTETCRANVPARTRLFTGRETELAKLRTALTESRAAAICAVHGMGGVGKTTLATEYVHRYGALYGVIGWFRLADETVKADPAITGTSVRMAAGYAALARELGLVVAVVVAVAVARRTSHGRKGELPDRPAGGAGRADGAERLATGVR